jgi:hypothetical protein
MVFVQLRLTAGEDAAIKQLIDDMWQAFENKNVIIFYLTCNICICFLT